MKYVITLLLLLALGAGIYYYMNMDPNPAAVTDESDSGNPDSNPPGSQEGLETREASGTVTAVDKEQAMVDGPVLITIRQQNGSEAIIAMPTMGLPLCAARANLSDAFSVEVGQRAQVRGDVGADGRIVPCTSEGHYFRVTP